MNDSSKRLLRDCERIAENCWSHLALTPPLDCRKVAEFLNVRFQKECLPAGLLGLFFQDLDGRRRIIVTDSIKWLDQQTVSGHELAHAILTPPTRKVVVYRSETVPLQTPDEYKADLMAGLLLVPTSRLLVAARDFGHTKLAPQINKLCAHFGVSKDLMYTRLIQTGLPTGRRR